MEDDVKIETLEKIIANERGSVKWTQIQAISVFLAGIGVGVLLNFYFIGEFPKYAITFPALIGTAISGLSVKDNGVKRNRVSVLEALKTQYQKMRDNPASVNETNRKDVDTHFWDIVKRTT